MNLRLVYYPDPILRVRSEPIKEITDEIRELANAMLAFMKIENGVGLAAPQVGASIRLFVMEYPDEDIPPTVLVNPVITHFEGAEIMTEGCLSFPRLFVDIRRPEKVVVEALDIEGKPYRLEADGILARVIQHEFDHLDGRLFIDLFSPAQKIRTKTALKEMERTYSTKRKV